MAQRRNDLRFDRSAIAKALLQTVRSAGCFCSYKPCAPTVACRRENGFFLTSANCARMALDSVCSAAWVDRLPVAPAVSMGIRIVRDRHRAASCTRIGRITAICASRFRNGRYERVAVCLKDLTFCFIAQCAHPCSNTVIRASRCCQLKPLAPIMPECRNNRRFFYNITIFIIHIRVDRCIVKSIMILGSSFCAGWLCAALQC